LPDPTKLGLDMIADPSTLDLVFVVVIFCIVSTIIIIVIIFSVIIIIIQVNLGHTYLSNSSNSGLKIIYKRSINNL
jgi:hypothetical protein